MRRVQNHFTRAAVIAVAAAAASVLIATAPVQTATAAPARSAPLVATSAASAITENMKFVAAPKVALATPTITGMQKVGATLTASAKSTTKGATLAYQWYASGAAISGATKPTLLLTSAHASKAITVKVTAKKTAFTSVTATSTATKKIVKTAIPTVSGTAKVGATLTAAPGTWTSGTTLKYQWSADNTAISGATKSTLVLGSAQSGEAVTVTVTGSQSGYTTFTETSKATSKVVALQVMVSAVPTISGEAHVGTTLTAEPGAWTPGATLAYQWFADDAAISDATTSTLVIAPEHAGTALTVKVTGSLADYATVTQTSTATLKAVASAKPSLSGQAKVGGTLTVNPGAWTSGVTTFDYTWFANGVEIAGATSNTLTLTDAQASKTIGVAITSAQAGYARLSANATLAVKTAQTSVPTITGLPTVGATLTAEPGQWTNGTMLRYQWFAGQAQIAGARESTWVIAPKYAGMELTVKVTGTRTGYATFTETSKSKTEGIGAPTISGEATIGGTLTVDPGKWPIGVSTFTYAWLADGVEIDGATSNSLTLAKEQAEKTISVRVTSAQEGYEPETVTAPYALKAPITSVPNIQDVSGSNRRMHADPGVWTQGMEFAYEWFADGVQIDGKTENYIDLPSDIGAQDITLRVTGTLAGYTTVSATSGVALKAMTMGDPTLEGERKVGATLTAVPGAWTPGTVFSYQWFVMGDVIDGETGPSLLLTADYVGKPVAVIVTGTLDGYETLSIGSPYTGLIG